MISVNDEHSLKAESAIDVIDDGIDISVNNEQFLKLLISMFFCDNKSLIIS